MYQKFANVMPLYHQEQDWYQAVLQMGAYKKRYFIEAVQKGKQYDYSNPAVQFCSKFFDDKSFVASSK